HLSASRLTAVCLTIVEHTVNNDVSVAGNLDTFSNHTTQYTAASCFQEIASVDVGCTVVAFQINFPLESVDRDTCLRPVNLQQHGAVDGAVSSLAVVNRTHCHFNHQAALTADVCHGCIVDCFQFSLRERSSGDCGNQYQFIQAFHFISPKMLFFLVS